MKSIKMLFISIAVLCLVSCSILPMLPTSRPAAIQTLIKIAMEGEQDKDGDWINRNETDELFLTAFYIRKEYVGCAASDGLYSFGGYYEFTDNKYWYVMAMNGQIMDAQELSKADFAEMVKEFMKLWNASQPGKTVMK